MQEPKVTILMPVYNGENYLKAAIDSILAQTYRDFELLIINDGSTDATQAIIESYNDSRIRVHLQENQGVSRSLNQGIAMTNTKYIRRHDADDFSEPNMLATQMAFLKAHPDIQFVGTRCAFMTDRGKVAYNYTQPKAHIFGEHDDYVVVERSMFNPYSPIVHGSVLGSTAIFKAMGGYRTEFLTSEDNDLWLRIIEHYRFAVLKHPYYYLRINATSATQVHKPTISFYRELSMKFAKEREEKGSDLLQRGEPMPKPSVSISQINLEQKRPVGKIFRADILNFRYKVALNAKDFHNIINDIKLSLKDGWRLSGTWKAIIFPILGERLVNAGVAIKQKIL